MTINPDLLIAAPMLQDFLISKTGIPLANGTVTMYQDNSRTTLKNWYYQSGSPGAYTYITLPNPLTLSAAGTIVDVNGNDTIPFYYPYSEDDQSVSQPYYITVYDQFSTLQFTRQNFPFNPGAGHNLNSVPTLQNLITNGQFWRNIGSYNSTGNPLPNTYSIDLNGITTNYSYLTVSPSQHDGFTLPDMVFMKGVNTGTDTITFQKFGQGVFPLTGDVTPEYYIEHTSGTQPGQTFKAYLMPISLHLQTLEGTEFMATIQAINNGTAAPGNQIVLYLMAYAGTGAVTPALTMLGVINAGATWQKYSFPGVFTSTQGLNLSSAGDDAYYLVIALNNSNALDVSFTLPSVYLGATVPTDSFTTYDQVNSIISSPRTGDIRVGMNSFYYFGWVPMNGGTLCNSNSGMTVVTPPTGVGFARQNTDTWPLFNLLWNTFSTYNIGTANPLAQMYNSAGTNIGYGMTAIADWNAFKQLRVTYTMGQVLLGTVPMPVMPNFFSTTVTSITNGGGNLIVNVGNGINFFNGMPIVFTVSSGGTLPAGLSLNTVYYVSGKSGMSFGLATSFNNAITLTVLPYNASAGSGTTTVSGGIQGTFEGEYSHTQLPAELAAHTHGYVVPTALNLTLGASGTNSGNLTQPETTSVNSPSGTPFNVTQPGVFTNMYIKL